MAEVGDELRCSRNDGRSWRCKLPALPGKLICNEHLEKDRIRYAKRRAADVAAKRLSSEPIPENPPPPSPPPASPVAEDDGDGELRVPGRDHLDRQKKRKHSWAVDMIDAYSVVDDVSKKDRKSRTWRKSKLNLEDIEKQEEEEEEEEKIVQEKNKKESNGKEVEEDNSKEKKKRRRNKTTTVLAVASGEEVTKDLPHGTMAIYLPLEPPSAQPSGDAPPPVKLGFNRPTCRLVDRNCRTKNVEPTPISTVKAVPYAANVKDKAKTAGGRVGVRRLCHWCKTNCVASLIKCLSCKKKSFCSDCIKKRCIDAKELEKRCIVCRGTCECDSCLTRRTKDAASKESSTKKRSETELRCFHYLISLALPILEKINEEKRIELETEAKLKELENSAREIVLGKESAKILDASLHCSLCSTMAKDGSNKKGLLEASKRKHPGDNFLYCPSVRDDAETVLTHFQNHWRNYHPVVVRNLLEEAVKREWDPIVWFSNYLNMCLARSEDDKEENNDPDCMDWYKVEFSSEDTFSGSLLKTVQSTCETLKLKARLSSAFSQRVFAVRYAEIVDALPIQQYTNPGSGILNLAAKSVEGSQVSGYSPHVYITCGNAEEIRRGELVSELIYSSHDLVNILVHASDFSWSSDEINKTKKLMRMKKAKDTGGSLVDIEVRPVGDARNSTAKAPGSETGSDSSVMCSGTSDGPKNTVPEPSPLTKQTSVEKPSGMQWDIFRRQDAQKLVEYIKKHSDEFYCPPDSSKQVTDPFLNGSFYLDPAHKMKLKEEFKIEPWTFTQKLGEAVIIPAGCPYQNRSLKSCMNVVVGFLSPENAGESMKLADKLEALNPDHKAKPSKLEVQKMVINKIGEAIKELRC